MSTAETRPAGKPPQASTRHLSVDARFARLLAEDFGIAIDTVLQALEGEPQKQAIAICPWASRADDPARALLAWARKHHKGRCRRRRTARRPSRRHGEAAPGPREQQDGERRGQDTPRADEGLRGVLVDADTLDRIAARLGVS